MPLLGWLLNVAFVLLILAVSPVLLYRRVAQGKYRTGWSEKLFGNLPRRESSRPCLWLHAVSVGEVLQLQAVVRELAARHSEVEFVITTTTGTGLAVAREKFPRHTVCHFPLDFTWAVLRAIRRVQPTAIVLVELELWPNLILSASWLDVPVALINGRISAKSFRGYRRMRFLMKPLLRRLASISVQNEEYAERLKALGAPVERLQVTGSIKFDGVQTHRGNPRTLELRQAFGIQSDEPVFIAGSTQAPEEEYALDCWQSLREEFPRLRLILVPRHQERFEEVAELARRRGIPLRRRSQTLAPPLTKGGPGGVGLGASSGSLSQTDSLGVNVGQTPRATPPSSPFVRGGADPKNDRPVLLLDTLGELAACWGLAAIAFVGGSLTNRGGQNMIEPAGYGAAVLFGPNTWNFRDVTEALLSRHAARVVHNRDELTDAVRSLLRDSEAARSMGQAAQAFVLAQRGATAKTVDAISALLRSDKDNSQRRAA